MVIDFFINNISFSSYILKARVTASPFVRVMATIPKNKGIALLLRMLRNFRTIDMTRKYLFTEIKSKPKKESIFHYLTFLFRFSIRSL